jgi:drug/metabolite transporter (DMT)-like permease
MVAWATTGEQYTAAKLAGAALALVGVAIAQYSTGASHDPVREAVGPVD